MKRTRLDMHDAVTAGAGNVFGQDVGASMPMPAPAHGAPLSREGKTPRSWLSLAGRIVRNAAIAVALMTLVPIGLTVVRGDRLARMAYNAGANTAARVSAADPVRPYRLPVDPSITPMQAGLALNALQQHREPVPGFTPIEPTARPSATWRTLAMSPGMFKTARSTMYATPNAAPASQAILEAAANGFTPQELEYLRKLATAPVWREFDLVARAPAVDIIGGQFRIPFGAEASSETRPLIRFKDTREIADAAVSRAAYYMARGDRASAETVLRSIVSFGFVMIDNSSTALDELIGSIIVGTGRDALQRFYALEHDPRANASALAPPSRITRADVAAHEAPTSTDDVRRETIARVDDPTLPPGARLDALRSLSLASCTNPRELLFGPRADVADVLARARRTLARYPSERALIDLQSQVSGQPSGFKATNPLQAVAVSAASISSVVLQNPRITTCTMILSTDW
jgi:hypothetical protein